MSGLYQGHKQPAKIKTGRAKILAGYILAAMPMVPALIVNPDWMGHTALGWKLAAVGGIVVAAIFVEAGRHVRPWYYGLMLLLFGLFGTYCNSLVAMKNASHASEGDAHARKTHNLAAKTTSSQSSQSSERRSALVALAGEIPSATCEAQIQAAIAKDIVRWNLTEGCKDISAKASGTFCAGVATLRGKKTAAEKREEIDKAATSAPKVEVEMSEDPFADTFPAFARGFGVTVPKEAATPHLNGVRSIWLELGAGFGPMAVLVLWGLATKPQTQRIEPAPPRQPEPAPAVVEPPEVVLTPAERRHQARVEAEAKMQRLHDMFVADNLEDCNGVFMLSAEPWEMWKKFCAARGEQPGSQKTFSQRLAANFTHDPNGGRPRFLNVRAKRRSPKLAVVGGSQP